MNIRDECGPHWFTCDVYLESCPRIHASAWSKNKRSGTIVSVSRSEVHVLRKWTHTRYAHTHYAYVDTHTHTHPLHILHVLLVVDMMWYYIIQPLIHYIRIAIAMHKYYTLSHDNTLLYIMYVRHVMQHDSTISCWSEAVWYKTIYYVTISHADAFMLCCSTTYMHNNNNSDRVVSHHSMPHHVMSHRVMLCYVMPLMRGQFIQTYSVCEIRHSDPSADTEVICAYAHDKPAEHSWFKTFKQAESASETDTNSRGLRPKCRQYCITWTRLGAEVWSLLQN